MTLGVDRQPREIFIDQRIVNLDGRLNRLTQEIANTRVFRMGEVWSGRINTLGKIAAGVIGLTCAVYVLKKVFDSFSSIVFSGKVDSKTDKKGTV
jgi:hypothetical protein